MSSMSKEADLEALFDTIADARQRELRGAAPAAAPPAVREAAVGGGDSPELESLFDAAAEARQREIRAGDGKSVEAGTQGNAQVSAEGFCGDGGPVALYTRIGNLARQLHEALREVGADQILTRAVREVPDARDRLAYVARMTEQAADRVLEAVEIAQTSHNQLSTSADTMAERWNQFFARRLGLTEFCDLARDTRMFVAETQGKSVAVTAQLHEIMMAQDFQDLTGQVIQKLTKLTSEIESQLLRFLIEMLPPEKQAEYSDGPSGPAIVTEARSDVVTDQGQVDELLESLGF